MCIIEEIKNELELTHGDQIATAFEQDINQIKHTTPNLLPMLQQINNPTHLASLYITSLQQAGMMSFILRLKDEQTTGLYYRGF